MMLAVPSCLKSVEDKVCTLPGTLSAGTVMPGTGVVPTTTICCTARASSSFAHAETPAPRVAATANIAARLAVAAWARIAFTLCWVCDDGNYRKMFGVADYMGTLRGQCRVDGLCGASRLARRCRPRSHRVGTTAGLSRGCAARSEMY